MTAPFKGKRVLVTGGTGFLGGRLVERLILEQGADVSVLVRNFAKAMRVARFGGIRMVPGALDDADAVMRAAEGCDFVFHCAHDMAGTFKRHNLRTNLVGMRNVISAVRESGARMLYVSSIDVYGRIAEGEISEQTAWRGAGNFYAEAKRRSERYLWKCYRENPFPVSVIQPAIIYGPYAPWTLFTCNQLLTGRTYLPADADGCCNAVHVDDVVDAAFLAATRDEALGEAFVIAGPDAPTWGDWFRRHQEILGVGSFHVVSSAERWQLVKQERRSRRLLPVLRAIVNDGTAFALVRRLLKARLLELLLKGSAKVVGDLLFMVPGCGHWDEAVKRFVRRLRARARSREATDASGRFLANDTWEAALYASRAKVSSAKAHQLLGYQPHYTFETGTAATAEYTRWAFLVNFAETPSANID